MEGHSVLVESNRRKLAGVVRAVLFCVRQGISLREHRDDARVSTGDGDGAAEGNFRQLQVASGHRALEDLENVAGNARYT